MRLGRGMKVIGVAVVAMVLMACKQSQAFQTEADLQMLAEKVVPSVEQAVGLPFKEAPAIALRSQEQVRSYLINKMNTELPAEELEGLTIAYRLFGLIPDTLDLRDLFLDLYTEQVVGYYDPDSTTLYVVEGTDPTQIRLVLAHELVHALQGQYVQLDSLLTLSRQSDQKMAVMAVMEGQATLGSLVSVLKNQDLDEIPDFWTEFRQTVRAQHEQMPVLSNAPVIVREGLIFPYLAGADFVRWFNRNFPDTVPFGDRLPESTEQILHPERYLAGDQPVELKLQSPVAAVYEDELGEFDTRVLMSVLSGSESVGARAATGWAGDRYGVYQYGNSHALVWWTLWDTEAQARRFSTLLEQEWYRRPRPRRSFKVVLTSVGRHPAVRLIDAPVDWNGWRSPPIAAALD